MGRRTSLWPRRRMSPLRPPPPLRQQPCTPIRVVRVGLLRPTASLKSTRVRWVTPGSPAKPTKPSRSTAAAPGITRWGRLRPTPPLMEPLTGLPRREPAPGCSPGRITTTGRRVSMAARWTFPAPARWGRPPRRWRWAAAPLISGSHQPDGRRGHDHGGGGERQHHPEHRRHRNPHLRLLRGKQHYWQRHYHGQPCWSGCYSRHDRRGRHAHPLLARTLMAARRLSAAAR